jgi:hypothetical protein
MDFVMFDSWYISHSIFDTTLGGFFSLSRRLHKGMPSTNLGSMFQTLMINLQTKTFRGASIKKFVIDDHYSKPTPRRKMLLPREKERKEKCVWDGITRHRC